MTLEVLTCDFHDVRWLCEIESSDFACTDCNVQGKLEFDMQQSEPDAKPPVPITCR